jgi:uncharacterized protein (TIGR02246 family)
LAVSASTRSSPSPADESSIRDLHRRLLDAWNDRDAARFGRPFTEDGMVIGFDGSEVSGSEHIAAYLKGIFDSHPTARYLAKVRSVRVPVPDAAVLHAVVGMVPPGTSELNEAVNAVQSLVAVRQDGEWRIALFQNTPAQYHGRPEDAEALTRELRALIPNL